MVYHRLPFEKVEINGVQVNTPPKSPNGILSALLGFFSSGRPGTWIAWEETEKKNIQLQNCVVDEIKYPKLQVSRIALTRKEVELFYKVFSKEAFWPTIFSFIDRVSFNHEHWQHFVKVNRLFAEKLISALPRGSSHQGSSHRGSSHRGSWRPAPWSPRSWPACCSRPAATFR